MVELAVIEFITMDDPEILEKVIAPLMRVEPVRVEKRGVWSVLDHVGTLLLIMAILPSGKAVPDPPGAMRTVLYKDR